MIRIQHKRYADALEILQYMQKAFSNDAFIYIGQALCLRHMNEVDSALSMLKAFPDYKENKKVMLQLIACYQDKQDSQSVLDCFDLLLSRVTTHPY